MQNKDKFSARSTRPILTNARSRRSYVIQNMCSKDSRKINGKNACAGVSF